ncbi:MAG: translation initiation factor IF-3 [Candidatus Lloydbacteria bacterium RIFCSPHIGHO2_01_FULL_49_22]|uniref:Translation initiation factor IF-3 n=1 Tax=Candidatus Lloydbacteria bacterium RIFCSPHIGHO2_01_FULL_49_22 TaxID=1798658 RepID=A0A1G2D0C4_9BACT|nr:MAG: translation initiation factor IF-3 [Candidatus Lloydbacteria bacterium RIFCSPHIGHO2_01_FULL_49_22]OGZ09412.1 MAG: translation initiation factor IF-3 [Candidatus Lloydbacteria bacterium RIFCSPHIGHO2_02_FULL_50_18]
MKEKTRINHQIKAPMLRVIDDDGSLGNMTTTEAIKLAMERGLDLIEISPNATPPVAKITDYGRFQYTTQKKDRDARAKAHVTETKNVQIKIGTSERDLELKAKKASEWLRESHRVKLDLFLPGRTKYMEPKFLEERLDRILRLVSEDYKVAEEPKKSPKGLTIVIERGSKKKEVTEKTDKAVPPPTIEAK